MKQRYKDELGHRYGNLVVIAYTPKREPSNGCVIWECLCQRCHQISYHNGNNLRFGRIKRCPHCHRR